MLHVVLAPWTSPARSPAVVPLILRSHPCACGQVEGDKWEMYIPSELGYGERGSPPNIGGGDVLVFTMEILKIKGGKVPASRCDVKSLEGCDEKESKYITSKKALGSAEIAAEIKRLEGMQGKAMAPDKAAWISKRANLLRKLKDEL